MAYVKSALWLLGSGALGYTLLLVIAPDEKIVAQKHPELHSTDVLQKRQAFVDTLRAAAESQKPMYRQTTEEIKRDIETFRTK